MLHVVTCYMSNTKMITVNIWLNISGSNILQRYNIDHTWEYIFRNKSNPDIVNEILKTVVDSIQTHMNPFNIQFVHNLLEDLRLLQVR